MAIEKNYKNILKHEESPFTAFPNDIINSIKHAGALGVYCYLASKPSNYKISKKELQKRFKATSEYICTCLNELEKLGLVNLEGVL